MFSRNFENFEKKNYSEGAIDGTTKDADRKADREFIGANEHWTMIVVCRSCELW